MAAFRLALGLLHFHYQLHSFFRLSDLARIKCLSAFWEHDQMGPFVLGSINTALLFVNRVRATCGGAGNIKRVQQILLGCRSILAYKCI